MYKTIMIGSKEVNMQSNAATPFRFKNIFGLDLLKIFTNASEENISTQLEAGQMLAFVMAKQAEGVDMNKLNVDHFYTWLEDYSSNDMYDALEAIIEVWQSSGKTSSTAKK